MDKPVSVMLLGLGGYGGYYVNYFLDTLAPEIPFRLCAGVDPRPDACGRLQELQQQGVAIYEEVDSAFSGHTPELVIISTPIHTHLPLTHRALESGASVLLEKPLCGNLAEADALLQAEASAPGFVAIGYQNHYTMSTAQLLDDIQSKRFGNLLHQKTLTLRPRNTAYFQRSAWAGAQHTVDGLPVFDGPAMNASAHMLYFQLLISDAHQVAAPVLQECFLARANAIENYDTVACRFSCGDVEHLFLASHAVNGLEQIQFHYQFEHAEVFLDDSSQLQARYADGAPVVYGDKANHPGKIETCLRALRGGPRPPCTVEHARRHIEVIELIQQTPIVDISPEHIKEHEGLLWIDGLKESFKEAYRDCKMPDICGVLSDITA